MLAESTGEVGIEVTSVPRRLRRLRVPSAGSVSNRCRAGRCSTIRSSRTYALPGLAGLGAVAVV